jgi:hypothetical protein
MMERVASHLSTCSTCASEFAELRREEEIYAHYRRDIEVTPAQWNIVRARIEQERETRAPKPATQLREWFGGAFDSSRRFRPALVAAILLIVIGLTAGIVYLNSHNRQRNLARKPSLPNETLPLAGATAALPSIKSDEHKEAIVEDGNRKKSNPDYRRSAVATGAAGLAGRRKTAVVVATLPRSRKPEIKETLPDNTARLAEAVAERDQRITGVRRSAPEAIGNFDLEVARHAERAELLLRSFRNVRLPATRSALDISYEKENARKLLYQNIALRRDALSRRDQPTTEILNKLEPILLDIANLPDRARARDVRSIERHMKKKEIVAALQVRTLVAAN